MSVGFKESWKNKKFVQYLDEVPRGVEVETSMLSKTFCLSSAAAAGILVGKRGDFVKSEPGLWRKTG